MAINELLQTQPPLSGAYSEPMTTPNALITTACAFDLSEANGLQILPYGTFRARSGDARPTDAPHWVLTETQAEAVLADLATLTNDIPIYYEHQDLRAKDNGQPAPVAGWVSPAAVAFQPGRGLFANSVQWTEKARRFIDSDEYRYLSPLFSYRAGTGEITQLVNLSLVNSPGIDGMLPVLAALAALIPTVEEPEPMKELLKALALPETATEADALVALSALQDKADKADEQLAALQAQIPDPASTVPVAAVKELSEQLAALQAQQNEAQVTALIQANMKKLPTKGLRDWAEKQSLAALSAYLETAPELPGLDGMQSGGTPPGSGHHNNDAEAQVIAALGLDTEIFNKYAGVSDDGTA